MKMLYGTLALVLAQSVQAAPNSEAVIRLQIASIDSTKADTVQHDRTINDDEQHWVDQTEQALIKEMTKNKALAQRMSNERLRRELLHTIYYEAKRAGLAPSLVVSVIRGESNFRKYAISSAGARGFMQVMPFWADIVGADSADLFNVRTNLRLGCAILRSYLDKENGNITRALARYNGSRASDVYPNYIYAAWAN